MIRYCEYGKYNFSDYHSFEFCGEYGKIDKRFLKLRKDADILSQYYLIVRYPLEYKEAGEQEAKEAIKSAEKIIKFIKSKIK